MLVLFSGVPSSGKTTLARTTARHFNLALFSRDTVQGFLYQRELVQGNTVERNSQLLIDFLSEA